MLICINLDYFSHATIWYVSLLTVLLKFEMQVRLTFDEPEAGVTIIKLKQTDVPEEDKYVELLIFLHAFEHQIC